MIDAAAEGGATHGKIQSIFAADLSFRPEFDLGKNEPDGRTTIIKRPYQPEYDRLKKLELTYDQQRRFVEQCIAAGLQPLTTAFNLTCIPFIKDLGWRSIKVASYDCGSLPLIKALASNFDELIISTGATFDEEIQSTARLLNEMDKPFSLLHCVTLYPTPLDEMNLARMNYLRTFTKSVGLSDHSLVERDGVKAALAAIYLGAEIIERHFTVLSADQTRDGRVSIRKEHLREMQAFSAYGKDEQKQYLDEHMPEFSQMIGNQIRELSHEEMLNRAYYRGRFANKLNGRQVFNWEKAAEDLLIYA
jgi:sialic acid synthase SpsE